MKKFLSNKGANAKRQKKFSNKLQKMEMEYYESDAIPMYVAQPKVSRVFRFINNNSVPQTAFTIGRGDVLGLVNMQSNPVAGGAQILFSIFDSILVRKIRIWSQPGFQSNAVASGYNGNSISVSFPGPNAPTSTFSDYGNAVNRAYLSLKPPKDSFASLWSNQASTANEVLFIYTGSPGDIIDLHVTFVILDGVTSDTSVAPANLLPGVWYNSMDQATSVLVPVTNQWSGL
jgi:hypothetical protein